MAEDRMQDLKMDPASLYREEIYTDRRVGTIRVMAPVKADGTADPARKTVYAGEAQMMTNMGPLPLSFEIEAASIEEAVANYGPAAKASVEKTVRELQEMRRQAASSIVVPQGGMGAIPGGGLGGGGKIQMP
jgi:hypothetical protein